MAFSDLVQNFAAVDLGKASSFGDEAANMDERFITLSITSEAAAAKSIVLCPSYFKKGSGIVIADGGTEDEDITVASGSDATIAEFLEYQKRFPTRVLRTQISSNKVEQFDQTLIIQDRNVFGDPNPVKVPLASFKSPTYQNDKLLVVPTEYQLDEETQVNLTIPGGNTSGNKLVTTVTFYFGAVYNKNLALYRIATESLKDPQTAALKASIMSGGNARY